MTQNLQRFTTEYIVAEDRIRLAGEVKDASPVVIWLTQRLLQRLLPMLLQWLEERGSERPGDEVWQTFAQQAAQAELPQQDPVQADAACAVWLTEAVDIAHSEETVCLTFRGGGSLIATMSLSVQPLRQWLGIVYGAYRRAEWPLDVWPDWMRESGSVAPRPDVLLQ